MGKASRQKRQNGNNMKDDEKKKILQSKDDQICTKCENEISNLKELNQTLENEISNLRQLNQKLVKNIETSRAGKLAELESQIHTHQAAATNLQSQLNSIANERELLCQKNRELSSEAESLSAKLVQLEAETLQNERVLQQCRTENNDLQSKLDSMANERELLSQKNRELSTEAESLNARLVQLQGNERVLQQCRTENNDLQSDLNDSRERIQDLLRKAEEDTHFWDSKKSTLEGTVAALQTKHKLMAREMGSLTQKNTELSIEVESFKYLGNASESELKRTLQKSEEDQQHLKSKLEGTIAALQTEHDLMASERRSLTQKNNALSIELESFKYQLNVLKGAEHSLKQHNETLQEKVNSTKCLLQKQNQRFAESSVENGRLNEQVEELSERFGELHETNVKLLQEKDAQRMEFESLRAEAAKKYRELEENHLKSLKQNEEHGKMIESLHEDMMLQLSKNKTLEEELISTKESISKGEVQIANLRSQLLTVAQEKDGQLSDIQRQLSAMAEEKKKQLDQLSSISARNKSLQTELDRRTLVSEEEKVRLEGRVRELQKTFNSLNKELESSRLIAEEKKGQFADLQNRHSDLVKAKRWLEEKNESLVSQLNRCTMVSKENDRLLQNRIRELEASLDSVKKDNENRIRELETSLDYVKKDNESKDNLIQQFMSLAERQSLQPKPVLLNPTGNGNGNGKWKWKAKSNWLKGKNKTCG